MEVVTLLVKRGAEIDALNHHNQTTTIEAAKTNSNMQLLNI